MDRTDRLAAIRRIVSRHRIRSQHELGEHLAAESIAVNQATLSRDLRSLGLVKGPHGYVDPQAAMPADPLDRAVQEWLLEALPASNQVVLKTPPSGAQPLARVLDEHPPSGVLGTLAGDDTILVICSSASAAKQTASDLTHRRGPSD